MESSPKPEDLSALRVFGGSYAEQPELLAPVFRLLDGVFKGIAGRAAAVAAIGTTWESVSRPFVAMDGDRVLSHVGLIDLPLVLDGRRTRVGSIHAVATHRDARRRGLYRAVMEVAERDAFGDYETLVLTTENPEYYEPFGFRVVPEHEFRVEWDGSAMNRARSSASPFPAPRRLDLRVPEDLTTLFRLLDTRAPVSEVCGIVADRVVFCFSESGGPLWYLEDLDTVCVVQYSKSGVEVDPSGEPDRLEVYDIVAPQMPRLLDVLLRLPGMDTVRDVVLHVSPDSMGVEVARADRSVAAPNADASPLRAVPVARVFDHDGPSLLMVRGPFVSEGTPFTLPRTART